MISGWLAASLVVVSLIGGCAGSTPTTGAPTRETSGPAIPVLTPASAGPIATLDPLEVQLKPGIGTLAFGAGSVWVGSSEGTVTRVDPATGKLLATIELPERVGPITFGAGHLWVAGSTGKVYRLRPGSHEVDQLLTFDPPVRVVFGGGILWVLHSEATISTVDPKTSKVISTAELEEIPAAYPIAASAVYHNGSLWLTRLDTLARVTAGRDLEVEVFAGRYGGRLIPGGVDLWLSSYDSVTKEGAIARVDRSGEVDPVARGPWDLVFGAEQNGTFWLSPRDGTTLVRAVPTASHLDTYALGEPVYPGDLAIGFGHVWVTDVIAGNLYRLAIDA